MPRKKGPPVYAERGANPCQLRVDVPEGWTGEDGRFARAAMAKDFPTASEYIRRRLDEALKKDGF
jgi:hypothetical protein